MLQLQMTVVDTVLGNWTTTQQTTTPSETTQEIQI